MKWKTVDIGPGCYYITGTITQWLPLLKRPDVRQTVYDDIAVAARDCGASITAFVSEFVSGTSSRNTEINPNTCDRAQKCHECALTLGLSGPTGAANLARMLTAIEGGPEIATAPITSALIECMDEAEDVCNGREAAHGYGGGTPVVSGSMAVQQMVYCLSAKLNIDRDTILEALENLLKKKLGI